MKNVLAMLLILALLVSACASSETPAPEPTQKESTATATSAPGLPPSDEATAAPAVAVNEEMENEAVPESIGPVLIITDGTTESAYGYEQLVALGPSEASFRDVVYVGVPLHILLQDAGFDMQNIRAVKVVAVDGFSANYDSSIFLLANTLVAYARADGELAADEKPFRMVVPEGGGGMNVRLLNRIEVIP